MSEPTIRLILDSISASAAVTERPLPDDLGKPQFRRMQAAVAKGGYDAENHTVTMTVSSETPVERFGGYEVLSHAAGAIDTGRLDQGIPYLFNHNWDAHIGRSQAYAIKDGKLTITNKFGTNPLAREKEQDVADGILVDVSIGYQPTKVDITEDKNGVRTFNVAKWVLFENSSVTVPADYSVGVNRSATGVAEVEVTFRKLDAESAEDSDEKEDDDEEERKQREAEAVAQQQAPAAETTTQPTQQRTQVTMEDIQAQNQARVTELRALQKQYPQHYTTDQFADDVTNGTSARDAKNAIGDRVIASTQTSNVRSVAAEQLDRMSEKETRLYSAAGTVRAAINQLKAGTFVDAETGFALEVSDQIRKDATERGIRNLGPGILRPGTLNARFAEMEAQKRTIASGGPQGAVTNVTPIIVPPIELLRGKMVSLALGAVMLPGLFGSPSVTRQNAAGQSNWLAEGVAVTNTDPGLDFFQMQPHRLSMMNSYFRDFLALSALSIDSFLAADRNAVLARSLDYAGINGSGVAPVPKGLLNQTGLAMVLAGAVRNADGSVTPGTGGKPMTYVDFNNMEATISTANGDIGTMGIAMRPKLRSALRTTPKLPGTASGFVFPDSKQGQGGVQEGPLGYNTIASTQVPTGYTANSVSNLDAVIMGVFDQMLFGDWDLGEVIADNITGAAQALYKITEHGYYDTNVRHIEAFCACTSALAA